MGLFNFLKLNKNKDLRKPECPYCNNLLDKIPGKKTRCVNCGNFMLVRTTPKGNNKVVVTEDEARGIDMEWAKINGTYDDIIRKEEDLNKIRKQKREKYGKDPSESDVQWSYLNFQLLDHIKNNNWGLYTSVKREMAEILKKEGKLLDSLAMYLTVCFLDINGANNSSANDPELLKEFPVFDPSYYDSLSPGIIKEIKIISKEKNLQMKDIKDIFIDRNNILSKYGMPLSPEKCWIELEKELINTIK